MSSTEEKTIDIYEKTTLNENSIEKEISNKSNVEEQIDNLDQLMDGKEKVTNEFDVSGNIAQTQAFIQTVKDFHLHMSDSEPIKPKLPLDKTYDLCNQEECIEFIEQFKDSEYLAVAIMLCTFCMVSLGDLPNLQIKLMRYLSKVKTEDGDKENQCEVGNPYISLNSILAVIGGKRFTTDDGQKYVTLGNNSIKALANIVEQFPVLRRILVSWLIDISQTYEYHTTFDIYQIITALARVISLDVKDAEYRIFPHLYSHEENIVLLGGLFYELYEYEEIRENVKDIYLTMLRSNDVWLMESNCIACSFFSEMGMEFPLENELKKEIKKKWFYLQGRDLYLLAGILFETKKLRDIFISSLANICNGLADKRKKIKLAKMYLTLIRFEYYQIRSTMYILPLVACDTKEQQMLLLPILEQIMQTRQLRNMLYIILKGYIKDLSRMKISDKVIKYISAYFYNLILVDSDYEEDIFLFLDEIDNKISKQILKMLQ